jgi:hypothetical protein
VFIKAASALCVLQPTTTIDPLREHTTVSSFFIEGVSPSSLTKHTGLQSFVTTHTHHPSASHFQQHFALFRSFTEHQKRESSNKD